MLLFLSLSFSTENVWIVPCHVPHKDMFHTLFINFFIIFQINKPTAALQNFQSQYVTCICWWEFQRNFFMAQPYSRKQTKIGRAPLDYWSARRKDFCQTTHNTYNRQIYMPQAGIHPIIPPSQRPQSHFLDRAATVINKFMGIHV